jgi:protein TonB
VANVRTEGIEFPYPVYLQNVVRQIALQFRPSAKGALRAEVAFLIRRDGSVAGLKLVTRSGSFSFDQDAMGAVEAAARADAFGPLPAGFTDDVLPVIFSFDPRLIR